VPRLLAHCSEVSGNAKNDSSNTCGVTLPESPASLAIRGQIFLNVEALPGRRAKPEKPGEHRIAVAGVEVNANACSRRTRQGESNRDHAPVAHHDRQ
jgi:hypothetical protein